MIPFSHKRASKLHLLVDLITVCRIHSPATSSSAGYLTNIILQSLNYDNISAIGGAAGEGKQQFFRTTPQDSFVPEGGRAIINCVIGDLAGRVQWTKDGLTLGKLHNMVSVHGFNCLEYLGM